MFLEREASKSELVLVPTTGTGNEERRTLRKSTETPKMHY